MAGLDSFVKLYSNFNSSIQDDYGGKTLNGNGLASIFNSVFGNGIGQFTRADSSQINAPDSADWSFGSDDWTLEGRFKFLSLPTSGQEQTLFSHWGVNQKAIKIAYINSGGTKNIRIRLSWDGTSNSIENDTAFNFSVGVWYHIAIVRSSTNVYLFIDGVLKKTISVSTNSLFDSSEVFCIGSTNISTTPIAYLDARIDELRISDNARWTSGFTVPTTSYSDDANTLMLLHFEGTHKSTTFTDSSSYSRTITASGSAKILVTSKFGVGSLELDSSLSEFVYITDDADFNLSNVDWTFDLQLRFESLPSTGNRMCIFSSWNDTTDEGYKLCVYNNSGSYELEWSYTTDGSTENKTNKSFSFAVDVFYHIAVERDGATVELYVDGTSLGTYSISTDTIHNSSEDFKLGAYNTTETDFLDGFYDEFRFSKGIARYQGNFTPPTQEYNSDSTAPTVTTLSPLDGATGVAVDTNLVIEFSETVVTASAKTITVFKFADNSEIETIATNDPSLSIASQTVTIELDTTLDKGTQYYVTVDEGAFEDSSANAFAGITVSTDWDFTTIAVSTPSIYETTATILICDYVGTVSAESGTVEGTIYSTAHGYNTDDFIVNTTQNNTSRRMLSTTTDTIVVTTVSGQTQSDIIRLYKFTDHTGELKQQTLNVNKRIEEDTEARFTLITDGTYIPRAGQYVKVTVNSNHVMTGVLRRVKRRLPQNGVDTKIFFDCEVATLNILAPRRTLAIEYDIDTTASVIVESMVNDFLVSEGVTSGTIQTGTVLDDDWYDDSLSIADIMDSLAEKSGYQWFIDKNFNLQFYDEPATVTTYSQSIVDTSVSTFNDFRNVTIDETIDNYNNKAFYVGNTDDYGNIIIVSQETTASILEIQDYSAGSGVYGAVVRDSELTKHNFYTATAGTTETQIVATNIGDEVDVGDLIFNTDKFQRRNVIASSGNTITLQSAISGQTQSDVIVVYQEINDVVDNHLKRSDVIPRILEFDTFTTDFEPTQKIEVLLSKLSVTTTETYIIESVNIQDRGAGYYVAHVQASKRNASNLSSQRTPTYKDYFREF